MSPKQFIFFFALLYLECDARGRNFSLDHLKGQWMISNASENAAYILGDCPSVEIDPPPKKNRENNGKMVVKIHKMSYTVTLVASESDQSTYQLLNTESFPLGNLSILTAESKEFLIAELNIEESYYVVLTRGYKTPERVFKKINKFWNSSDSTKNVPLLPIKQENCESSDAGEVYAENNALHITSITVEEVYIADEAIQLQSPSDISGSTTQSTPSRAINIATEKPEVTSIGISEITPQISTKLTASTRATTLLSNTSSSPQKEIHSNLPKNTNDTTVKMVHGTSTTVLPSLTIVSINIILLIM